MQNQVVYRIRAYLNENLLLRWMLSNIVGWSIGLYAGSLIAGVLGGLGGLILGGAIAGLVAGGAQYFAIYQWSLWQLKRWLILSTVGGGLGAFTVFLFIFSLIAGKQTALLIWGALYGGIFGGIQSMGLQIEAENRASWWILANILSGGLCALLSPLGISTWLPIICTPGPLIFGGITGYVLLRMLRMEMINSPTQDSA